MDIESLRKKSIKKKKIVNISVVFAAVLLTLSLIFGVCCMQGNDRPNCFDDEILEVYNLKQFGKKSQSITYNNGPTIIYLKRSDAKSPIGLSFSGFAKSNVGYNYEFEIGSSYPFLSSDYSRVGIRVYDWNSSRLVCDGYVNAVGYVNWDSKASTEILEAFDNLSKCFEKFLKENGIYISFERLVGQKSSGCIEANYTLKRLLKFFMVFISFFAISLIFMLIFLGNYKKEKRKLNYQIELAACEQYIKTNDISNVFAKLGVGFSKSRIFVYENNITKSKVYSFSKYLRTRFVAEPIIEEREDVQYYRKLGLFAGLFNVRVISDFQPKYNYFYKLSIKYFLEFNDGSILLFNKIYNDNVNDASNALNDVLAIREVENFLVKEKHNTKIVLAEIENFRSDIIKAVND